MRFYSQFELSLVLQIKWIFLLSPSSFTNNCCL